MLHVNTTTVLTEIPSIILNSTRFMYRRTIDIFIQTLHFPRPTSKHCLILANSHYFSYTYQLHVPHTHVRKSHTTHRYNIRSSASTMRTFFVAFTRTCISYSDSLPLLTLVSYRLSQQLSSARSSSNAPRVPRGNPLT